MVVHWKQFAICAVTALACAWCLPFQLVRSHALLLACASSTDTEHSYYDAILEAAFRFLSPLQQNLLKFCLSLRSYSASIQAFQQVKDLMCPGEQPFVGAWRGDFIACQTFFWGLMIYF